MGLDRRGSRGVTLVGMRPNLKRSSNLDNSKRKHRRPNRPVHKVRSLAPRTRLRRPLRRALTARTRTRRMQEANRVRVLALRLRMSVRSIRVLLLQLRLSDGVRFHLRLVLRRPPRRLLRALLGARV